MIKVNTLVTKGEPLVAKGKTLSVHREYLKKLCNLKFLCGAKPLASIKRESEGGGEGEATLMPTGPAVERRQIILSFLI